MSVGQRPQLQPRRPLGETLLPVGRRYVERVRVPLDVLYGQPLFLRALLGGRTVSNRSLSTVEQTLPP